MPVETLCSHGYPRAKRGPHMKLPNTKQELDNTEERGADSHSFSSLKPNKLRIKLCHMLQPGNTPSREINELVR